MTSARLFTRLILDACGFSFYRDHSRAEIPCYRILSKNTYMEQSSPSPSSHTADCKKRKVEEMDDGDIPAQELGPRHPELWFADGSIVLAAHGTMLKVHSGVLSWNSPVLRDLLDGLSADAATERYEGCPVLRVEDSGEDLAKLVRILYDGGKR